MVSSHLREWYKLDEEEEKYHFTCAFITIVM